MFPAGWGRKGGSRRGGRGLGGLGCRRRNRWWGRVGRGCGTLAVGEVCEPPVLDFVSRN